MTGNRTRPTRAKRPGPSHQSRKHAVDGNVPGMAVAMVKKLFLSAKDLQARSTCVVFLVKKKGTAPSCSDGPLRIRSATTNIIPVRAPSSLEGSESPRGSDVSRRRFFLERRHRESHSADNLTVCTSISTLVLCTDTFSDTDKPHSRNC